MKVLGHHVAVPAVMLALIDGGLFLFALYALGLAGTCRSCYLESVTHLQLFQALLVTSVFVMISAAIGLYNRDCLLDFRIFLRRFALASQFVFIPTVAFFGIAKAAAGLPFGWYMGILSIAIGVFFAVLLLVRVVMFWALDLQFLKRRVLVVGGGPEADAVIDFISNHGTSHLRCVGHLKNDRLAPSPDVTYGNLALHTELETHPAPLLLIAQSLRTEEIVLAASDRRGLPMWQLLECKLQGIQVSDYLTFWERETAQLDLENVGPGWLALQDGFRLNWARRIIKRWLDVAVSLIFLSAALPIGLIVALAIKLDSKGPIFYKQERVGRNGQVFWIWKFRSMRTDAEGDGVPKWAAQGDNRVTRVGRIIRKLRFDEFPQVFNVLKGDMSFIGPRPERPFFVEQLRKDIPLYDLRHRLRPGITGWAQVNYPYGASPEDAKRKLAYDLYYIKNHNTTLDLVILLQTVRVFLFSHGSR
jgi:sugar transferase (PEP-CTERM system associated)